MEIKRQRTWELEEEKKAKRSCSKFSGDLNLVESKEGLFKEKTFLGNPGGGKKFLRLFRLLSL